MTVDFKPVEAFSNIGQHAIGLNRAGLIGDIIQHSGNLRTLQVVNAHHPDPGFNQTVEGADDAGFTAQLALDLTLNEQVQQAAA